MKILNPSRAGSLESNDIFVMVHPSNEGIKIDLQSKVYHQYGKRILEIIEATINELRITHGHFIIKDSGALDYTIKARVTTAIQRSIQGGSHE